MSATVQVIAVDDVEFLDIHEATLHFAAGKKIGIDWRRCDGLIAQHSGWTVAEVINAARAAKKSWSGEPNRPDSGNASRGESK